jgi:hypothetical protein
MSSMHKRLEQITPAVARRKHSRRIAQPRRGRTDGRGITRLHPTRGRAVGPFPIKDNAGPDIAEQKRHKPGLNSSRRQATVYREMTDSFALLGEPRRPWIDTEALKTRFLILSAATHPDRFHGAPAEEIAAANARSAELNAAHNTLRESRDRLFHLLELERGTAAKDIQRIPPGTMDLFVEIGQACRDADQFLASTPETTSPMLKLQRMRSALEWTDKLLTLQGKVNLKRDSLETELKNLNPAWETAPPPPSPGRAAALPLERLDELARAMSYVTRWTAQIQERLAQLAA